MGEGGFSRSISTFSPVTDLFEDASSSFSSSAASILTYFLPVGDYGYVYAFLSLLPPPRAKSSFLFMLRKSESLISVTFADTL